MSEGEASATPGSRTASGSEARSKAPIWIAVICTASFLLLGLLAVFGPDFSETHSGDADVYSPTAIGHAALHDLLVKLGVPVHIHRDPERKALPGRGLLAVLEPDLQLAIGPRRRPLVALVESSPATFLALPKWEALWADPQHPRATSVRAHDSEFVMAALWELNIDAELVRTVERYERAPSFNTFGREPVFSHGWRQLLRSDVLEPLIAYPEGILLGRTTRAGREIYVLSDPDLLQNHGLHRGHNAELVVRCFDRLREDGPVSFAETLHGFRQPEQSVVRELFAFPMVLLVLHGLLTLGLLLWAGLSRFGDAPPPEKELQPGSDFLIKHTAHLLRFGGHRDMALVKYVEGVRNSVVARYRMPRDIERAELTKRLDELSKRMKTTDPWSDLVRHARLVADQREGRSEAAVMEAARRLHRWKREILNGTRRNSRDPKSTA